MDLSELVDRTLSRRRADADPLRIVQAGHPALRARARSWEGQLSDDLLAELVAAMTVTMREAPGVGLAAPQVGIPLRLMLVEDRAMPDGGGAGVGEDDEGSAGDDDGPLRRHHLPLRVFLDPEYEVCGPRRIFFWEGCLSVSGWQSIVPRAAEITARGLERAPDGTITPVEEPWDGWPARIFQHETDHLAGTLCHDRAVPRSFVDDRYVERYADLGEAVRRLGLEGDISRLEPGRVELD